MASLANLLPLSRSLNWRTGAMIGGGLGAVHGLMSDPGVNPDGTPKSRIGHAIGQGIGGAAVGGGLGAVHSRWGHPLLANKALGSTAGTAAIERQALPGRAEAVAARKAMPLEDRAASATPAVVNVKNQIAPESAPALSVGGRQQDEHGMSTFGCFVPITGAFLSKFAASITLGRIAKPMLPPSGATILRGPTPPPGVNEAINALRQRAAYTTSPAVHKEIADQLQPLYRQKFTMRPAKTAALDIPFSKFAELVNDVAEGNVPEDLREVVAGIIKAAEAEGVKVTPEVVALCLCKSAARCKAKSCDNKLPGNLDAAVPAHTMEPSIKLKVKAAK